MTLGFYFVSHKTTDFIDLLWAIKKKVWELIEDSPPLCANRVAVLIIESCLITRDVHNCVTVMQSTLNTILGKYFYWDILNHFFPKMMTLIMETTIEY